MLAQIRRCWRTGSLLRRGRFHKRICVGVLVYLAAVLEYVTAELM
jgi:hypothetical protein